MYESTSGGRSFLRDVVGNGMTGFDLLTLQESFGAAHSEI